MITSSEDCAIEVFDMSRKIESVNLINPRSVTILSLIVMCISGAALAAPEPGNPGAVEERASITRHTVSGGRDNPVDVVETTEDYAALVTAGDRNKADTRGGLAKPGPGSVGAESGSHDFWIYEADVILFNDDDGDGYFYGIDLLFDADTIYGVADVYAVLYLSYEGGPWNEYAVTEDFTIFGASGSDEYVLVTELMSGYPTGSYDLLIELFDPFDGAFLASLGPIDSSELGYLPLEDYDRDAPVQEARVVINHGSGGGGIDGWFLSVLFLILFVSAIRKIWRRRNDVLMRIDSPAPCWRNNTNEQHRI